VIEETGDRDLDYRAKSQIVVDSVRQAIEEGTSIPP
jgi:hypothetical protein